MQCDVAASTDKEMACRPLERLENIVRQSGGVVSLIDHVGMLAKAKEMRKSKLEKEKRETKLLDVDHSDDVENRYNFLDTGDIPPTEEELEFERSARMPESPFTRVLRKMGSHSSPYQDCDPF